MTSGEFALQLFTELRKELLETQKLRGQIVGFKLTFAAAALGVIAANIDKLHPLFWTLPAAVSTFFDLLISSNDYGIRRFGHYCRTILEPQLRDHCNLPAEFVLWEEFMYKARQQERTGPFRLPMYSHTGITALAWLVALVALYTHGRPTDIAISLGGFVIAACAEFWAFRRIEKHY